MAFTFPSKCSKTTYINPCDRENSKAMGPTAKATPFPASTNYTLVINSSIVPDRYSCLGKHDNKGDNF